LSKNSQELVRRYFDREAERFDAIYEGDKPLVQRAVDRLFRGVILERFRLICALAPLPTPWSVLDVGCGSGRYALALARAGAARVVGVDVSATMIDLARKEAVAAGVDGRCHFTVSSFADFASDETFDVGVATGYFDYLEDPRPDLRKMVERSQGRIYATFPRRWEPRVVVRKMRFALERGYVRFYDEREVRGLFAEAGVGGDRLALFNLGRDFLAVARVR
jgi:ubiquinone/menaquinone biosynthesis C-methylase UbiE